MASVQPHGPPLTMNRSAQIWTEDQSGAETVVYDNGMHQPIGGGNIVVHARSK